MYRAVIPNGINARGSPTFQMASQTLRAAAVGTQTSYPRSPVYPVRETITSTPRELGADDREYPRSAIAGARRRGSRATGGPGWRGCPVLGDVLDGDVERAGEALEVGEVRLGRGEGGTRARRRGGGRRPRSRTRGRRTRACSGLARRRASACRAPGRRRGSTPRPAAEAVLYSGEVSKRPAALRIAKYSNFSDIW